MDLLLIDPPRVYWGFGGGLGFFSPPVGLVTLAGYLEQQGVQVDILDCNAAEIGWEDLGDEIARRHPSSVGVSSSMTCYVDDAFRCLELVKQIDPSIHTIGGGLQFTLAPEECLSRCDSLDVIVRGDGEYTCLELLEQLEQDTHQLQSVDGISFRENGRIVHTPDRPPIMDLDALPLPAYHLLPMPAYRLPVLPPRWGNYALVVTARGCPYQCSFCSPRLGQNPYRKVSGERALEMLDRLYYDHDVRVFWFSDLSFNVDRARTEHILDGIIERGWKVRIALDGTRTDLIVRDQDLLPKMKQAGVFLCCLGVETPSPEELQAYRKGTSPQTARQAVDLLRHHGIHSWTFLMTGLPHHRREDMERTLEYTKELDPLIAIFTAVMPVPGTAYHEQMEKEGLIRDKDWRHYDMGHPVLEMEHMTPQEYLEAYERCFSGFYGRPSKIIRHGIFGDQFARYTYGFLRFVNSARQIKDGAI